LQLKLHAVAAHVALPFAGATQLMPQLPQFVGSLVASTHEAPQRVGVGAEQPVEQAPPAHTGVAPTHARAQAPQVVAAARSASQPFAGSPSQSAKPGAHAKPHVEPSHVANPLAGASHGVQLAPQDASDPSDTQTSPHR